MSGKWQPLVVSKLLDFLHVITLHVHWHQKKGLRHYQDLSHTSNKFFALAMLASNLIFWYTNIKKQSLYFDSYCMVLIQCFGWRSPACSSYAWKMHNLLQKLAFNGCFYGMCGLLLIETSVCLQELYIFVGVWLRNAVSELGSSVRCFKLCLHCS